MNTKQPLAISLADELGCSKLLRRRPMRFSRLLCRLGVHGPEWFGYGPDADGNRNYRIGPMHRGCDVCGAEWVGSEGSGKRYRYFNWQKIEKHADFHTIFRFMTTNQHADFHTIFRRAKEERYLFDLGYSAFLPPDVQQMFDEIDAVIAKAIKEYFK